MPVEFHYDRDKKVLRGAMISSMTMQEFAAALEEITTSEQFPPNIRTLWDLRELDFKTFDRNFEERLIDIQ